MTLLLLPLLLLLLLLLRREVVRTEFEIGMLPPYIVLSELPQTVMFIRHNETHETRVASEGERRAQPSYLPAVVADQPDCIDDQPNRYVTHIA